MRYLLDVNVLIALIDPRHPAHNRVHGWLAEHSGGIALCPLVENGAVRVMSQAAYAQSEAKLTVTYLLGVLAKLKSMANDCLFWPDAVSIADTEVFDHDKLLSHRQITDSYLLGLAVAQGGGLVTVDQNIVRSSVRQAQKMHLLVL
jgi:uncharacterized protein